MTGRSSFRKILKRRRMWLNTHMRTRHIHGPKRFKLAPDEVCGLLMGRNIAFFIPEFMAHHRAMGMKYLVFLDNGSDDDSVALMRGYDNVIILSNRSNFRDYQKNMRMHMARHYAVGGWRLAIDADEILRFPGDELRDLPDLVRLLEARGHTGLLGQMLEMVPAGPLEPFDRLPFDEVRRDFTQYSLDDITSVPYHFKESPMWAVLKRNTVADERLTFLYGGLRRALFGEDCCLSKHVLFRSGPNVLPLVNPHVSTGLNMADFTVLLQHYKFSGGFLERETRRQVEKRLSHNETDLRLSAFAREPDMSLNVEGMRENPTPEGLLEAGFLMASNEARKALGL